MVRILLGIYSKIVATIHLANIFLDTVDTNPPLAGEGKSCIIITFTVTGT